VVKENGESFCPPWVPVPSCCQSTQSLAHPPIPYPYPCPCPSSPSTSPHQSVSMANGTTSAELLSAVVVRRGASPIPCPLPLWERTCPLWPRYTHLLPCGPMIGHCFLQVDYLVDGAVFYSQVQPGVQLTLSQLAEGSHTIVARARCCSALVCVPRATPHRS
jgi:hypothetical protein